MAEAESDGRILTLFDGAGPVDTPTPGARVWLARDLGEGRAVMVKRVPNARKARATEALSLFHNNIVRTRRWLEEGDSLYVVRDVIKGKNLRQALAALGGAKPTAELLRKIITPVIDALAYAHSQGLPHGGVSPDNIIVADAGGIFLTDFATTDPTDQRHYRSYQGRFSVIGDVKALAGIVSAYLPNSGAFGGAATRGKLEGILSRCDTLDDLRETLNALERLAVPTGNPPSTPPSTAQSVRPTPAPVPQPPQPTLRPGPPPLDIYGTGPNAPQPPVTGVPIPVFQFAERSVRLPQGGGGSATLVLRNDGTAPLVIRMIATQHAWLNLREPDLPMTIGHNGAVRIGFIVSAARLTPGEYRSEVYVLANAGTATSEDQRNGWHKHSIEILITVESPLAPPRRF